MEDFRKVGERVRNWGRWGDDDEKGTLNLVTPEALVRAGGLVKKGKVFDLGIPLDMEGPQVGTGRTNPKRLMSSTGRDPVGPGAFRYADDFVFMPLQAASQWDGLSHVWYDEQLYNGFPSTDVTDAGAAHCSIDKVADGVVGRGVLLDVARHKGQDWLDHGYAITPADLDEVVAAQGVELHPGDVLLVRTGWRKMLVDTGDRNAFMAGEPGLAFECAEWLHGKDIAAIACDNWAVEVLPGDPSTTEALPFHMVAIRDIGLTLGEMLDFEALADDCDEDKVYECLFCGPVLKFTGGVGTPINPLALK
jgi:kynurenine formamidase